MEWTIPISTNSTGTCEVIFYDTTLETCYDDIILTFNKSEIPSDGRFKYSVSIVKIPDTIIYNDPNIMIYDNPSTNIFKIICGKYLVMSNVVIDIYTGKQLCDNGTFIFETKYKNKNYIFSTNNINKYAEIYDGDFNLIKKLPNLIFSSRENCINENYIVLYNTGYLQVYDFVNDKIIFEDTVCTQFLRWHKNLLFCQGIGHVKVREIINKDGCSVCFEDIKEKYACVPCGHTTTCYNCLTDLTTCPICRTVIESKLKLF
jgi:hypothetical protein